MLVMVPLRVAEFCVILLAAELVTDGVPTGVFGVASRRMLSK